MPCDHTGPSDVITMVEERLREQARAPLSGMKFQFGENHEGFFVAALTEIERRGEAWVVTRLDRLKEPLPDGQLGLRDVSDVHV